MTDYVRLSNRGPIGRTLEFVLGMLAGFALSEGVACKLPEGAQVGVTCDETGCQVQASGELELDEDGNLMLPGDALSGNGAVVDPGEE